MNDTTYKQLLDTGILRQESHNVVTTEINIYNNVQGGLGNFSGYNSIKSNVAIVE